MVLHQFSLLIHQNVNCIIWKQSLIVKYSKLQHPTLQSSLDELTQRRTEGQSQKQRETANRHHIDFDIAAQGAGWSITDLHSWPAWPVTQHSDSDRPHGWSNSHTSQDPHLSHHKHNCCWTPNWWQTITSKWPKNQEKKKKKICAPRVTSGSHKRTGRLAQVTVWDAFHVSHTF